MRTLHTFIFLIVLVNSATAQTLRLLAIGTTHTSASPLVHNSAPDSSIYYYSPNKGLSSINGKFIADSIMHYNQGKEQARHISIYNNNDEEIIAHDTSMGFKQSVYTNYNNNNQTISVLTIARQNGGILGSSFDTFIYNGTLLATHKRRGIFVTMSGNEIRWSVNSYTYDVQNNLIEHLHEDWDTANNTKTKGSRNIYTYDAQNNIIAITTQYWDSSANNFYNRARIAYTYTPQNRIATKAYQTHTNNQWKDDINETYSYDTAQYYTLIERVEPYWQTKTELWNDSSGKLIEEKQQERKNNSYKLMHHKKYTYTDGNFPHTVERKSLTQDTLHTYFTTYYYSKLPKSIPNTFSADGLLIFPNPSTTHITIQKEWQEQGDLTAVIYDIQGHVLKQWKEPVAKTYTQTIPVTELQTGHYILQLQNGKEIIQKQFAVFR